MIEYYNEFKDEDEKDVAKYIADIIKSRKGQYLTKEDIINEVNDMLKFWL